MIPCNLVRLQQAAALTCALLVYSTVDAASDAKVFPVKAFFRDDSVSSTLDPRFLAKVQSLGIAVLSEKVYAALNTALINRLGPLSKQTAGRTFAVSFHVTRANSYLVNKGNGNSDLVASVTASLYFTNVLTGEILTSISDTVVGRAVIANSSQIDGEKDALFLEQIDKLISILVDDAAKNFNPIVINLKITDRVGKLLILDAGYAKGIQVGDSLSDSSDQLIEVIYVGKGYSVAQPILADSAGPGAVFQKYMSHAADGKVKPRTVVLVESIPEKFSKEFISQLFSDAVGGRAPLSMVQVNPGFSSLLQTVVQQASLSEFDTSHRKIPELFIRLRVAEPIVYEAGTNLEFKTVRHYETLAFADIVDTSGRVNFSAIGKDVINDDITRNIGAGFAERREVSIKNALNDLANQMSKLSELRREQTEVIASTSGDVHIVGTGKVFYPKQKGVVLQKAKVQLGQGTHLVWIPTAEASVESIEDASNIRLGLGLPFRAVSEKTNPGGVFEVQRLGVTPRSAQTFVVCGPTESLGTVLTPSLMDIVSHSLGNKMPGMLYAPTVVDSAKDLIGPATGFISVVPWGIPQIGMCVQPVERVNAGEDVCTSQCERPMTARYTLRVKSGSEVVSRSGFETQFRSTSFYKKTTSTEYINRLIDADLIDEAQILLDKAADKITFTAK